MNITKKCLALILIAALVLPLLPAAPLHAATIVDSGKCGENVTWSFDSDGVLRINGGGAMETYEVTGEYELTALTPWRQYDVQEVVIGSGITEISNYAFMRMNDLTRITIPGSVEKIGPSSFDHADMYNESRKDSILLVCESGSAALEYAKNNGFLFAVSDGAAEDSVIAGTAARMNWRINLLTGELKIECTGNMPAFESVELNPYYKYRPFIRSLNLDPELTRISDNAFRGLTYLTEVRIPNKVASVGDSAFFGCTRLTSVSMSDSVKKIGNYAFSQCGALDVVKTGDGLVDIGEEAFSETGALRAITLSDGLESIGERAFFKSGLRSVRIPDTVTEIGDEAFGSCPNLADATIGEGLTRIGSRMFYYCAALAQVEIGDAVEIIEKEAFSNCAALKQITFPVRLTKIDERAFEYSGLVCVMIPDSVITVGKGAFRSCQALTSLKTGSGWTSLFDYAFTGCTALTELSLGKHVAYIGKNAFSYCASLTGVTIPDGVATVSPCAFAHCDKLSSVTLGHGLERIGSYAFAYCPKLAAVEIPFGVFGIGRAPFRGCDSLRTVSFPASVQHIGITLELPMLPNLETIDVYGRGTTVAEGAMPLNATIRAFSGSESEAFTDREGFLFEPLDEIHTHRYYGRQTVAPTCQTPGEFTLTCVNCGDSHNEPLPAVAHTANPPEEVTDVFPNAGGNTCIYCGTTIEEMPLPETEHDYKAYPVRTATCAEEGLTRYVCARCGDTYEESVPLLEHTPEPIEAVPATCAREGSTAGSVCAVCGEILVRPESVPKTEHIYIALPAVKATCTESGLTQGEVCTVCGYVLTAQTVVPALGHLEPNEYGVCARCGKVLTADTRLLLTGECGADAVYSLYSDGLLTISGTGPIRDYEQFGSPIRTIAKKPSGAGTPRRDRRRDHEDRRECFQLL